MTNEKEEKKVEIKTPENYLEGNEYTLYTYGDNVLNVSNSWSRKSIRMLFRDTYQDTVDVLNTKCTFILKDEFGVEITKDMNVDHYEELPIDTVDWIIETLVGHVDFLVDRLKRKRKEK